METTIDNGVIIYATLVTGACLLWALEKLVLLWRKKKTRN